MLRLIFHSQETIIIVLFRDLEFEVGSIVYLAMTKRYPYVRICTFLKMFLGLLIISLHLVLVLGSHYLYRYVSIGELFLKFENEGMGLKNRA